MIPDFNLLITTARGNERAMINEILYLLKEELGDPEAKAAKTKIRGLIVVKTALAPCKVIENFRIILKERPYEIRYALRIIPIQRVVPSNLDEIRQTTAELATGIGDNQSFRVSVEKRYTSLHTKDLIEVSAGNIQRKVSLLNPDFVLQIQVLGALTGISLLTPNDVLAVIKEKML
jgi:tRNA acetyltransferase TAN1